MCEDNRVAGTGGVMETKTEKEKEETADKQETNSCQCNDDDVGMEDGS